MERRVGGRQEWVWRFRDALLQRGSVPWVFALPSGVRRQVPLTLFELAEVRVAVGIRERVGDDPLVPRDTIHPHGLVQFVALLELNGCLDFVSSRGYERRCGELAGSGLDDLEGEDFSWDCDGCDTNPTLTGGGMVSGVDIVSYDGGCSRGWRGRCESRCW